MILSETYANIQVLVNYARLEPVLAIKSLVLLMNVKFGKMTVN